MNQKINSFTFRRKSKSGYKYFYVDLVTEKAVEISGAFENIIDSDDTILLTDIHAGDNAKFDVAFVKRVKLVSEGDIPVDVNTLTADRLIDACYMAAIEYTKSVKED